jgi:hypothetical protein
VARPGLHHNIQSVVEALLSRQEELVERMLVRIHAEVPGYNATDDPEVTLALRESCGDNLRTGLAELERERGSPVAPPTGAIQEARAAAQARVPLDALLRTYRVGHAVAWEALLEEVEHLDLSPQSRTELLRTCSRYMFAYVDGVMPFVADEYQREQGRLLRRHEQRRVLRVREMLDGGGFDSADLGYELDQEHLAVVAWGEAAEGALRDLARQLGRILFSIAASRHFTWAWLGGRLPYSRADLERVESFAAPHGGGLAFGEPASGGEGFRASHRQARQAQTVATQLGLSHVRFANVAIESLALRDEAAAREFVARELGPLEDSRDANKLCETLRAYFATALNAASAAAALGINDRTVAYRIKVIEEHIGYPLHQRRLELETALRLSAMLEPPGSVD